MIGAVSPKPGDFGLVNIKGEIGWDIRLGQWLNGDGFNPYEHAFIYIGNGQIVEAEPGGARIANLSEYDNRRILWSTGLVPLTAQERFYIVQHAKTFVGTPYSFYDYFVIAMYRIHVRFPFIAKRVKNPSHMICSQLVAELYDMVDVSARLAGKPPYLVTPGALAKYLLDLQQTYARLAQPKSVAVG